MAINSVYDKYIVTLLVWNNIQMVRSHNFGEFIKPLIAVMSCRYMTCTFSYVS